MKIPDNINLYRYNQNLEELYFHAEKLVEDDWMLLAEERLSITDICNQNMMILDTMRAIILHLELVTDEILKLQGRQNDTDIQVDR